jgi:divalent metal cation (Fe/Co/Zn/Cd) transporter
VTFGKVLLASLIMAVAVFYVEKGLCAILPGHALWTQLIRVGVAILSGMLVLALAALALRTREFVEVVQLFRARLARRRAR